MYGQCWQSINAVMLYMYNEVVSIFAVAELCFIVMFVIVHSLLLKFQTGCQLITFIQGLNSCVSFVSLMSFSLQYFCYLYIHFTYTFYFHFSLLLFFYHFIFNIFISHQLFLSVHSRLYVELFYQSFPPERLSCSLLRYSTHCHVCHVRGH